MVPEVIPEDRPTERLPRESMASLVHGPRDHVAEIVDGHTGEVLKTFGPMTRAEARQLADGGPVDERFYTRAARR